MKFFVDTADVAAIRELNEIGLIDGVTTNPSLIRKSGRNIFEVTREICMLVDGPVSAEVTALDYAGMMKEADALAKIAENICKGFSLCFRSHQMLIGLLRSRHGSWTVPGDVRELLGLGKLVSSAVRQAGGPALGPD